MNILGTKKKGHRRAISLNDLDAEELIKREKLSRQLQVPLSKTISKDGLFNLVEHFLVFELVSKGKDDTSLKCICEYPSHKTIEIQSLEKFCFPSGLPFNAQSKKSLFSPSYKNIVEHTISNTDNSFVLLLTSSKKETMYAICIVDDILKDPPSFIEKTPRNDSPQSKQKFSSLRTPNSNYCYCIVSKYPYFDLFLNILLFILDKEEKVLLQPIESEDNDPTINFIEHIYQLKVPSPGKSIHLGIPMMNTFTRPTENDTDKCIGEFCVPTLFGMLEVDKILTILSYVMLEKSILFYSHSMRKLTNCIMSFVTLVKPFILQCVFIPVIPDSEIDILYAPVPFIAGITNKKLFEKTIMENRNEIITIDLDGRKINLPSTKDIDKTYPTLPNVKSLSKSLSKHSNKLRKTFKGGRIPFTPTKEQKEIVKEILANIREYLSNLFKRFGHHCIANISDNVTIFIKESFLNETNTDEEFNFFMNFLETQLFDSFCAEKLKEMDKERLEERKKKVKK